jgi:hypothetical protein
LTRSADPSAPSAGAGVGAGEAYGRDDPAYGPPGPDWYSREQGASEREQPAAAPAAETALTAQTETRPPEAVQAVQAEAALADTVQAEPVQAEPVQAETAPAAPRRPIDPDPPAVRGPFEPLVDTRGQTSGRGAVGADHGGGAAARPWGDDSEAGRGTVWSRADDDLDAAQAGAPAYEQESYEFPGIADDDPAGSADAALDRLKALHLTAASVAPQSVDAHFDQLLERQRKLISEYLGQAGGPETPTSSRISTSAGSSFSTADGRDDENDGSLVGFGDDHRSTR